jgi:hypothetical protein
VFATELSKFTSETVLPAHRDEERLILWDEPASTAAYHEALKPLQSTVVKRLSERSRHKTKMFTTTALFRRKNCYHLCFQQVARSTFWHFGEILIESFNYFLWPSFTSSLRRRFPSKYSRCFLDKIKFEKQSNSLE